MRSGRPMPSLARGCECAFYLGAPGRPDGVAVPSRLEPLLDFPDRIGDRHGALRLDEVEALDHFAVDRDHALLSISGLLEGGDDLAGPGDLLVGRRKDL